MTQVQSPDLTELLRRVADGDKQAEDELMPLIYRELHRVASAHLRRERPGHTLQTTALVHEVYLKMTENRSAAWKDRAHFFNVASLIMRRILVDYTRRREAGKRGGKQVRLQFDDSLAISDQQSLLVTQVDCALERLEKLNPRQAKVVELRFFAGLSEEEIAEVLGVTSRTVKRDWTVARAWLYGEFHG
jgi:RNA polymerase sigma-70 factor, ECF subfamily